MVKKYNRGASKNVYHIVTGDKWWIYAYEPESKQQMSQIQQKLLAHEALPSKLSPVFSEKLDMSQSYH